MRCLKLLLTLFTSLALTFTLAPTAKAEPIPDIFGGGDVSVSFADFRYPGSSCYSHRGSLNVRALDDYAYDDLVVSLDMTVRSNGQYVDGWFDVVEWSGDYTLDALLCRGIDPTGTYDVSGTVTVSGTVAYWDEECGCELEEYISEDVAIHDSFVVYNPHTASLAMSKTTYQSHGWKVNGAAFYDGRAWTGKRMYFQVRRNGAWRTITSKVTNSRGRVAFYFTPPRGTAKPYRIYTTASGGVSAKATKTFYLRRR